MALFIGDERGREALDLLETKYATPQKIKDPSLLNTLPSYKLLMEERDGVMLE